MKQTLILLGATGLTGSSLLKKAIENDKVDKIICYLRRPTGIKSSKLKELILNNEEFLELNQIEASNAIICCLGTTIKKAGSKTAFKQVDVEIPVHFAILAKKAETPTFVVQSSLGAGSNSSSFYLKCKSELENSLIDLNFNSLIIVRPSLLIGNRKEFRFGEKIGEFFLTILKPFLLGPLKKYRAVKAEKVANLMLQEALKGNSGTFILESDYI
jgi:uncharacterized protein YbjT (DUF2867 family)